MSTRRTRRNDAEVREAILVATIDLLLVRGYGALTLESVAHGAGVSKPVLYRRFPNRATLVFKALQHAGNQRELPQLQNDLRVDLIAQLEDLSAGAFLLGSETYRGLIGEADSDTLNDIAHVLRGTADRITHRILHPAQRRGELPPGPISPLPLEVTTFTLHHRIMLGESDLRIPQLVDDVALPLLLNPVNAAPPLIS